MQRRPRQRNLGVLYGLLVGDAIDPAHRAVAGERRNAAQRPAEDNEERRTRRSAREHGERVLPALCLCETQTGLLSECLHPRRPDLLLEPLAENAQERSRWLNAPR